MAKLCMILKSSEAPSGISDITATVESGVAPLAVNFTAGWDDTDQTLSIDFHEYEYQWSFDDSSSGNWFTGNLKNTAKGPVAAHVFDNAGTYTVTLTVKEGTVTIDTNTIQIIVSDPDTVYAGSDTICVNNSGDSDFSSAPDPDNNVKLSTDDLTTVTSYATAGKRILFKRGGSWSISGTLTWPENAGPVTIGAYGTGTSPDDKGIYTNNPQITINSGTFLSMNSRQNWRLMDIHFIDSSRSNYSVGGSTSIQGWLLYRLKVVGCSSCILWTHWNDSNLMEKESMTIAACDLSDCLNDTIFAGGLNLSILGNKLYDTRESHTVRIWQLYKGIISNNMLYGAALDVAGHECLKLHSPDRDGGGVGTPQNGTELTAYETQFGVISDNIFGGCGPWPVNMGPENTIVNEKVCNILFERNKYFADLGGQNTEYPVVALHVWARYVTVRNNIFDGSNTDDEYWYGIDIQDHGSETPDYVFIYNNTIYRGDASTGANIGIRAGAGTTNIFIRNNLGSWPNASGSVTIVSDLTGGNAIISNNSSVDDPDFIDPDNATQTIRDFSYASDSEAIGAGYSVPVYDDIDGNVRPNGDYDIGASEYY